MRRGRQRPQPILPGATLGILGSGQLGRMLALAAAALGYRVQVYSPETDSPAGQVAAGEVVGGYEDAAAIARFAAGVDLLTFEFENLSSTAVAAATRHTVVRPGAEVLATAQNRQREKQFLSAAGFPVATWSPLPVPPSREPSEQASYAGTPRTGGPGVGPAPPEVGFPAIVKTAGFGYDGKGQRQVSDAAELAAAVAEAGATPLVVEQVVPFDRELSVIGARSPGGEFRAYGPFENSHRRHVLDLTSSPVVIAEALRRHACELVRDLMEQLDVIGLLCVELFQVGDRLIVNEMAPRPHNSGHLTIDACATGQFEQHVRAVCGLPLGDPAQHTPAAMANLLGDLWPPGATPPWQRALAQPGVKLHLYAKREPRPGRKMGHLTALAPDTATAIRRATYARARLYPPHETSPFGAAMRVLQSIQPTAEQLVILTDDRPGFRLIRGAAGSGKTTAALMRIRQLSSSRLRRRDRLGHAEPVRVLVLAFNRTLRGYVKHLAAEQVDASDHLELTVETFSRWAWDLCGAPQVMRTHRSLLRELLTDAGVSSDLDYFVAEVEYIIGRFQPEDFDSYIRAQRTGRGRAPAVTERTRGKLLSEVIVPYTREKYRRGVVDWNDVALEAATVTSPGYDVVIVDEVQDLSANQLRAVLAHLKKDHTTTFIMDAVQRIYPQAFRWIDIGLNIRPEMVFTLNENHRNTMEIAQLAASVVQGLPQEEDGVLPNSRGSQRHGPPPELVEGTYRSQLNYMLDRIQPFLEAGDTIAILHPLGGGWFDFTRAQLRERSISYCELTREADWPPGPEQVALCTMHSAKGLEFDHVLLPGLNQEVTPHGYEEGHGTLDSLRRLVAMSIGRARKTASLGCKPAKRSSLIDLMDPDTYNLIRVD